MDPWKYFFQDVKAFLLYALFGVVIPLGVIYYFLGRVKTYGVEIAIYSGVAVSALGFAGVYFVLFWKRLTPEQKAVREKVKSLMKSGAELKTEQTAQLTAEDRKKFKWLKLKSMPVVVLVFALALFLVNGFSTLLHSTPLQILIVSGTTVAFVVLLILYGRSFDRQMERGTKTIVRGIVTKKSTNTGTQSSWTLHYFIYLGTMKVSVSRYVYRYYQIGDGAEFHLLKLFGNYLVHHRKVDISIDDPAWQTVLR